MAFSKNDRGNISRKELKAFKEDAKSRLSFTDEQIREFLKNGNLIEIIEEDVHRVAMKRTEGSTINSAAHAAKKED